MTKVYNVVFEDVNNITTNQLEHLYYHYLRVWAHASSQEQRDSCFQVVTNLRSIIFRRFEEEDA
jgi:hypothetical protein